jgi:branched-chain amino acid transport system substrate-binding protein
LPLVIYYYDTESTEAGAAYAARRAIEDGAAVILGDLSSPRTAAIAEVAASSGTPVFSPTAAEPDVLDLPRVHSMARRDGHIGAVLGRFLVAKGWLDIAGIADRGGASPLYSPTRAVRDAGGRLVAVARCPPHQSSYVSQLNRLHRGNPDVALVFCAPGDAPRILADAQSVGMTAPIIAGPSWDHPAILALPSAGGVYLVTYFHRDDPVAADFVAAFRGLHDTEPDGVAALAHDAATVVIDALDRARSLEPSMVDSALENNVDLPLATGVPAWHRKRAPTMAVVQIAGGTTVFVDRVAIR